MTAKIDDVFKFPRLYNFPAFFTRQPTLATRDAQLAEWSSLILSYCRHYRLWRLGITDAIDTPLFHNAKLKKRLSLVDAREVVDWMTGKEGGERAEWVGKEAQKAVCWVYWKRPEEWAGDLYDWADATGQRNTVLTLYEIAEGDTTISQEFHGMDQETLHKSLNVLVKRGKAQIFGNEDHKGVKFF